jgi:Steigviridae/Suoliviridae L,D-carboxypeptidase/transpeptidase
MKLKLQRDPFLPNGTIGQLFVEGNFDRRVCFTLEPRRAASDGHLRRPETGPPNEKRITQGSVCIPAGEYRVTIDFSPRFQRPMPRVLNVPGREGILIHWGNYVENTEGCILVGSSRGTIQGAVPEPAIWDSRATFDNLYREIEGAQAAGVVLTIRDADAIPYAQEREMPSPVSAMAEEQQWRSRP